MVALSRMVDDKITMIEVPYRHHSCFACNKN